MTFIFNIVHYNSNFKKNDEFDEWITAASKTEAIDTIKRAYPEDKGYECTLITVGGNAPNR